MPFTFQNTNPTTFPVIPSQTFEIAAGFPKFKGGGSRPIEGFLEGWINYDDLEAFVDEIMPPSSLVGGLMTVHPYGMSMPGVNLSYLKCVDWEIDQPTTHTDELDLNNYWKSQLLYAKLVFRSIIQENNPANANDPVPGLIHRTSLGGQVLSLDNNGLQWDDVRRRLSGGGPEPFLVINTSGTLTEESEKSKRHRVGLLAGQTDKINAAKLVPHIEHEVTWPRVVSQYVPVTAIESAIGKVNSTFIRLGKWKVPAECALFTGANIVDTIMSNGQVASELVYRFALRKVRAMDQQEPGGWNHFFRATRPEKVLLTADDAYDTPMSSSYFGGGALSYSGYLRESVTHRGSTLTDANHACLNLPGFYRLEMTPGDEQETCIDKVTDPGTGALISISLVTGYLDELAIFPQYDFRKLFQPEPATSSP